VLTASLNRCGTISSPLYELRAIWRNNNNNNVLTDAEYCILREQAAVRIPTHVDAAKFAPMLCAGATAFVALRSAGIKPGATVAVQGIGGVGHMAIQYAKKMGYRVVAISRGAEKEKLARQLGAHDYIDSTTVDAGAALRDMGYAALVLTSALVTDVMPPLIKGLGSYGKLIILSLPQKGEMVVDCSEMFLRGISMQALPTGPCVDSEEAVKFAALNGMECLVETFPLERANEAYGTYVLLTTPPIRIRVWPMAPMSTYQVSSHLLQLRLGP
jgi:D-arabinose 1-dehydrogenase-like Zn-dependent alcohol dehydrogenase